MCSPAWSLRLPPWPASCPPCGARPLPKPAVGGLRGSPGPGMGCLPDLAAALSLERMTKETVEPPRWRRIAGATP
eukprot:12868924-Heterocapsa_arctica.AAC.1